MTGTTLRVGGPDPLSTIETVNMTPDRRLQIRNGCVLSMDPDVGDFAKGDILVEGERIAKIGRDLSAESSSSTVTVIDAAGCIVMPGFVDTYRHMWQGTLTPGKHADIVILGCSDPNLFPLNNAYGTTVMGADVSNIKAVIASGAIKKWGHGGSQDGGSTGDARGVSRLPRRAGWFSDGPLCRLPADRVNRPSSGS